MKHRPRPLRFETLSPRLCLAADPGLIAVPSALDGDQLAAEAAAPADTVRPVDRNQTVQVVRLTRVHSHAADHGGEQAIAVWLVRLQVTVRAGFRAGVGPAPLPAAAPPTQSPSVSRAAPAPSDRDARLGETRHDEGVSTAKAHGVEGESAPLGSAASLARLPRPTEGTAGTSADRPPIQPELLAQGDRPVGRLLEVPKPPASESSSQLPEVDRASQDIAPWLAPTDAGPVQRLDTESVRWRADHLAWSLNTVEWAADEVVFGEPLTRLEGPWASPLHVLPPPIDVQSSTDGEGWMTWVWPPSPSTTALAAAAVAAAAWYTRHTAPPCRTTLQGGSTVAAETRVAGS